MNSILIFAPHPDDETLSCSGIIRNSVMNGDIVNVVIVTNGDYFGRKVAQVRYYETTYAMKMHGLKNDNIIWLGFADTGMEKNKSFLYRLFYSNGEIISSPNSSCTYHPININGEFSMKQWNKHLSYNKASLLKCISSIIKKTNPTDIYLPSIFDNHGDHKALNLFINEVLSKENIVTPIRMSEYLIHGGNDKIWPNRDSYVFEKPPILKENIWKKRVSIKLPNEWNKLDIIKIYKSQISGSGYLESFSKQEEIFWVKGTGIV